MRAEARFRLCSSLRPTKDTECCAGATFVGGKAGRSRRAPKPDGHREANPQRVTKGAYKESPVRQGGLSTGVVMQTAGWVVDRPKENPPRIGVARRGLPTPAIPPSGILT